MRLVVGEGDVMMNVIQINVDQIAEDKFNRKSGGVDIIQSVGTLGVLQPIIVYQKLKGYKLIAGARRLASAKHFGLSEIPAIVVDESSVEIQAAENFDRKSLNPIDESDMINALLKKGMTREAIAGWLNISVQQVARREKLDNLCDSLRELVKEGKLSAPAASEFVLMSKDKQEEFLNSWDGRSVEGVSQAGAKELARRHGGRSIGNCIPALLEMVDESDMCCLNCPKCEGSSDTTLFEETDSKVCYNLKCFESRLATFIKTTGIPFRCSDPKLNLKYGANLDDSWQTCERCLTSSYKETKDGIDLYGRQQFYGKGKACLNIANEDPTREMRKLFNSHVAEMNEYLEDIEKLVGAGIEASYKKDPIIDVLAKQVLNRNYLIGSDYAYDGIEFFQLQHQTEDIPNLAAKRFSRALLVASIGEPIRWKKTGPNNKPCPPRRDNELIKLAEQYIKGWPNHRLRAKYLNQWGVYVYEQHRVGNTYVKDMLVEAGDLRLKEGQEACDGKD